MTGVPLDAVDTLPHRRADGAAAPAPGANATLGQPQQWFVNFATGNPTAESGPAVNEFTAFNYLAVYDCVSLIASEIAKLPLMTYRKDGRKRVPAEDRSEYRLLLEEFNPDMSAMVGRETGIAHLLTWGNSYTQIVRNTSGSKILALVPLGPDVTKPARTAAGTVYEVYERGTSRKVATLPADEVVHVPGLSFDGLIGYSPIRVARTAIRAGMAQDREAEKFITRGIRPPGAIKFPEGKKFRDEQQAIQYRDTFRRIHTAEDSALNVLILEDGADWKELGIDPGSAQLLESRRFSKREIAGMYKVPPHRIGDVDASTSWGSGIAEQNQAFVDSCLMQWMRRIESELKRKLAPGDNSIYYRHCVEELVRGDIAKRTAARQIQHQRGIITDNEWREDEHLDPVAGGDVRHSPLAELLIDLDGEIVNPAPPPAAGKPSPTSAPPDTDAGEPSETEPTPAESPERVALRQVVVSGAARCLRKEAKDATRAAGRPAEFVAWLDGFYGRHLEMVADHCGAAAAALGGRCGSYPARHVERSRRELLEAADGPPAGFAQRVERLTQGWLTGRLADIAGELQRG